MKRLHVHVNVADLERSVRFYSTLFGAQPSVRKPEYAKWMLEDPRVNFAVSQQGRVPGVDHLGIQAESRPELDEVAARLATADTSILHQEGTSCCYAKSDKAWSEDPSGIKWESFYTHGDSTTFGESAAHDESACCAPRAGAIAAVEAGGSCCAPSAMVQAKDAGGASACCS
jgi:catechol 2,3-dioxygenase-like lactoylglutathione lyase family enzyme